MLYINVIGEMLVLGRGQMFLLLVVQLMKERDSLLDLVVSGGIEMDIT
jgi:hypothetical protein